MTAPVVDGPRVTAWRALLVAGLALIASAVALGAVIRALGGDPILADSVVMSAIEGVRAPWLTSVALVFNDWGTGWFAIIVVPIVGAAALWWRRGRWTALAWIVAVALSALCVQLLKGWFGRERPIDIMVSADYGSFPSGHTANVVTIVVFLLAVVGRRAAAIVAVVGAIAVVLMATSRLYLGAHWLSDVMGGALLGAGVALVAVAGLRSVTTRVRAS